MAETGSIIGLVAAFIGIAIMLGVGTQILGNTVMDCTTLPDYNATEPSANATRDYGVTLDNQQTGWAGACLDNNNSTQNAYALLVIILIVVAAVAILFVVRML